MKHPCDQKCPERTPGCKPTCPRLTAYQESLRPMREKRQRDILLDGYQIDALHDNRRRYGWNRGRPKL